MTYLRARNASGPCPRLCGPRTTTTGSNERHVNRDNIRSSACAPSTKRGSSLRPPVPFGMEDEWRRLTTAQTKTQYVPTGPVEVLLDGVVFNAKDALNNKLVQGVKIDARHLRKGTAALVGAWWQLAWLTACREVQKRCGDERRCCRCRAGTAHPAGAIVQSRLRTGKTGKIVRLCPRLFILV